MSEPLDLFGLAGIETPNSVLLSLAAKEKKRRKERQLTQLALAKATGVSYGSIKRFERTGEISVLSLLALASVLGALSDFDSVFSHKVYLSIEDVIRDQRKP
jgi:transcriptional regulator with XRE-family HTH domain